MEKWKDLAPEFKILGATFLKIFKGFFSIITYKYKDYVNHKPMQAVGVFTGLVFFIMLAFSFYWMTKYKYEVNNRNKDSYIEEVKKDTAEINLEFKIRKEYDEIYQSKIDSLEGELIEAKALNENKKRFTQKKEVPVEQTTKKDSI